MTKNIKGKLGESFTAVALAWSKLFGRDGIVLRNVYIPKEDSDTAEIDLLFITRKGIFVIESKNYSGIITGNDLEKQWTAVMFAKNDMRKFLFYNPVMQNANHVKSLRRILNEPNVPMFSFIVFSDHCSISGVTTSADNTYVCNRSRLNKLIDTIWNQNLDALTELQVSSIAAQLEPLTKVSTEVRESISRPFQINTVRIKRYVRNAEGFLSDESQRPEELQEVYFLDAQIIRTAGLPGISDVIKNEKKAGSF